MSYLIVSEQHSEHCHKRWVYGVKSRRESMHPFKQRVAMCRRAVGRNSPMITWWFISRQKHLFKKRSKMLNCGTNRWKISRDISEMASAHILNSFDSCSYWISLRWSWFQGKMFTWNVSHQFLTAFRFSVSSSFHNFWRIVCEAPKSVNQF